MTDRRRLLLVNGPNLNLLGTREPELYGTLTLADIEKLATATAAEYGLDLRAVQSNHEGVLIDEIHRARLDCCGIVINAAAFTHTSVAIADALKAVDLPVAEVHLTNIHRREPFRHHSYFSDLAAGVIAGLGPMVYELAMEAVLRRMQEKTG